MTAKSMIKGLLTFLPGLRTIARKKKPGGTVSASYCYGVWMKHLTLLYKNGMKTIPSTVAELGPGDSIGTGLAAILSGSRRYFALDVVEHSNASRNRELLTDLLAMFGNRAPRPTKGWPDFDEYLDNTLFPSDILTQEILRKSLTDQRIEKVREALSGAISDAKVDDIGIKYMVPWNEFRVIEPESVDLIISHSVLEHVEDLEATYEAFDSWLKPGGWMSHQIDFTSHGLTKEWNGYRRHTEFAWKIIKGGRPYLINRAPCSEHISLLQRTGFKVICNLQQHRQDGIPRSALAPRWRSLSDEDLSCGGLFVQARKPQ